MKITYYELDYYHCDELGCGCDDVFRKKFLKVEDCIKMLQDKFPVKFKLPTSLVVREENGSWKNFKFNLRVEHIKDQEGYCYSLVKNMITSELQVDNGCNYLVFKNPFIIKVVKREVEHHAAIAIEGKPYVAAKLEVVETEIGTYNVHEVKEASYFNQAEHIFSDKQISYLEKKLFIVKHEIEIEESYEK